MLGLTVLAKVSNSTIPTRSQGESGRPFAPASLLHAAHVHHETKAPAIVRPLGMLLVDYAIEPQ